MPHTKKEGTGEEGDGEVAGLQPCDLTSCCCMLLGETKREVRARSRGENKRGRGGTQCDW